jgi:hypothetical protein
MAPPGRIRSAKIERAQIDRFVAVVILSMKSYSKETPLKLVAAADIISIVPSLKPNPSTRTMPGFIPSETCTRSALFGSLPAPRFTARSFPASSHLAKSICFAGLG